MTDVAIRQEEATDADIPALIALDRRCFGDDEPPETAGHLRRAMTGRNFVLVLREPWEPTIPRREPTVPRRGIVGFVVGVVGSDLHVLNLAVDPTRRRRGLGRRLLEAALDLGVQRGAESAFLTVRRTNEPALGLYRSLGFQEGAYLVLERRDLTTPPTSRSEERRGCDPWPFIRAQRAEMGRLELGRASEWTDRTDERDARR